MSLSASLGLSWGELAVLSELTLPGPGSRKGWRRVREAIGASEEVRQESPLSWSEPAALPEL